MRADGLKGMNKDDKPVVQVNDSEAETELKSKTAKNVEQALQNFDKKVIAEPPKKKHGWVGMVVLLLIIGLSIFFMWQLASSVGEDERKSFSEIIQNLNVNYALYALLVLAGIMFCMGCKFSLITHATTGRFKLLNSIKVAFLGKYYDGITPFSSGGQPMQILYLHRKGNSAGVSSAIVLINYFFGMLSWVGVCFCFMLFNRGALGTYIQDPTAYHTYLVFGWVGWAVNALLPLSVIFFAIFPKITNKILQFFINLITEISWKITSNKENKSGKSQLRRKIKILRRKEKWLNSAHTAVGDFRSSFAVMSHKPVHFILLVIICVCEQLITWAFPYFILAAFATSGEVPIGFEMMLTVMTLNIYATMSVTIIPTPGSSGALETVITMAFRTLAASVVFWWVFTWRFLTYYIYIIIGIGITIFEFIRKIVRSKRENKNNLGA